MGENDTGKSTYGLFYSPRDIRSKLNKSSNNTKRAPNIGNFVDTIGQAKYFKKLGKKNPLFDLSKTVLGNRPSIPTKLTAPSKKSSHLKLSKRLSSRNKSSIKNLKSPYKLDQEKKEKSNGPRTKLRMAHSGDLFDHRMAEKLK